MESLAYTGVSMAKFETSWQNGVLLPHNEGNRHQTLPYQRGLTAEYPYFYFALPNLSLIAEELPALAQGIIASFRSERHAYAGLDLQSALTKAVSYAVRGNIESQFEQLTGINENTQNITGLALRSNHQPVTAHLTAFFSLVEQYQIHPSDIGIARNTDKPKRIILGQIGSEAALNEALLAVFTPPFGVVMGWTNEALHQASRLAPGHEDEHEITIQTNYRIPLDLLNQYIIG